MPGQIVNISNNEAISEVSLKCGDIYFKDFAKNIYSQAVYRAERSVAKQFNILDRVWTYTNTAGDENFEIIPLNFNGVWRFTVTPNGGSEIDYGSRQFDDVTDNDDSSNYWYAILYNANQYQVYYTNAAALDEINIYYTSSIAGEEDYEPTDSEGNINAVPVLPNKYFEEIVRRAVRYMAQLGIATFEGEKGAKYLRVLKMHTHRTDEVDEEGLQKSRPFIEIKPFQYP